MKGAFLQADKFKLMVIDAHSHWSDLRWSQDVEHLAVRIQQLKKRGIDFFMQAGVDPEDWNRQIKIHLKFPEAFGLCFGLHPYMVADYFKNNQQIQAEQALDFLSQLLPKAMALGETGLDFREKILGTEKPEEAMAFQIEMFENQIQLAKAFQKPLVLHIVRAHEKALQVLQIWNKNYSGLVHAFTGSIETAEQYIKLGFLISLGTAVTFKKNHKLHQCVKKIPLSSFVIETDSPDQPPEGTEGLNQPENLLKVAEKIAEIRGISKEEVFSVTTENFKRVFPAKHFS